MSDKYPENPQNGDIVWTEDSDGRIVRQTYDGEKWHLAVVTTPETAVLTRNVIATHPSGGLNTQEAINQQLDVSIRSIETRTTALAAAQTNLTQNLEQAQGTKSRGTWQHHGGPLPEDGAPGVTLFWMSDEDGNKTQEFCAVKTVRINNTGMGAGERVDNVHLGAAVPGDQLLIQDLQDLDGCSYVIVSVEDKGEYAIYDVEPDNTYCRGSVTPAEICTVKLKKPVGTFAPEGDEYLPLSGGTVTGPTTFDCPTMVKWDAASSNSYPFSVYGGGKWSFRVGENGDVKIFGRPIIEPAQRDCSKDQEGRSR